MQCHVQPRAGRLTAPGSAFAQAAPLEGLTRAQVLQQQRGEPCYQPAARRFPVRVLELHGLARLHRAWADAECKVPLTKRLRTTAKAAWLGQADDIVSGVSTRGRAGGRVGGWRCPTFGCGEVRLLTQRL